VVFDSIVLQQKDLVSNIPSLLLAEDESQIELNFADLRERYNITTLFPTIIDTIEGTDSEPKVQTSLAYVLPVSKVLPFLDTMLT